jgi:hypothetical protein
MIESGESETDRCVLRGSLNYDVLLHHRHELAEIGIEHLAQAVL